MSKEMQELYTDIEELEAAKQECFTKAMAFTMNIAAHGINEECVTQAKAIVAEWDAYEFQQRQTLLL